MNDATVKKFYIGLGEATRADEPFEGSETFVLAADYERLLAALELAVSQRDYWKTSFSETADSFSYADEKMHEDAELARVLSGERSENVRGES